MASTSGYEAVKPFDGEYDLKKEQLAKYFNRVGRGLNCRMDIPVLTVEDVKWAATLLEKLAKQLCQIAYHDERPDIWRIMAGRYAIEQCRFELGLRGDKKSSERVMRKVKERSTGYD